MSPPGAAVGAAEMLFFLPLVALVGIGLALWLGSRRGDSVDAEARTTPTGGDAGVADEVDPTDEGPY
ncbi:MAG TPA: hypothetical protein VF763_01555 [Candidatus Limnocylindrales bacterium]